jgi:hypothetical protein
MRAREFTFEGEFSPSATNLVSVLETLRERTDQIRVDSLVNLVRKKPGSEMFNVDILADLVKDNSAVKNMIRNISDDDSGVKYVYLKGLVDNMDDALPNDDVMDQPGGAHNPQATVKSMAKRAATKRT